jgi:prevent-host-death family protein
MARSYSIATARAQLSRIVDEVEAGKEVELTRHGRRVAVVVSAGRYARMTGERTAFMTAYEAFRDGHDLQTVGVDPDWAARLRDRDVGRPVKL